MTRRALLVGSQVHGLSATESDLALMRSALGAHGFECVTLSGAGATRAGIIDGYRALIAAARPEDTVAFYFSGHGGLAINPRYRAETHGLTPRHYRFIVPTDIDESTADDFRGITNHELSFLLDRLLSRTENVTVVLDCCHAARLSRGATELVTKALVAPWQLGIARHLELLAELGVDVTSEGQRDTLAVGVNACGVNESAFECPAEPGLQLSVLTRFLARALIDAEGAQIDWRSLIACVREGVQAVASQRPVVEGQAARRLFSLLENDVSDALTFMTHPDGPRLSGGRLLGVQPGSRYRVVLPDAARTPVATATVTTSHGASSCISLAFVPPHTSLPLHAVALPLGHAAPALPVVVDAPTARRERIERAVAACEHLQLVGPGVELAATRISADGRELRAYDARSLSLCAPKPDTEEGLARLLDALRPLAKARALAQLESEPKSALDAAFELSCGTVEAGAARALPTHGAVVGVGERLFVRIVNRDRRRLWVSLIDIGVSAQRTLLNALFAPDGYELDPGQAFVIGERAGKLVGELLTWPSSLDTEGARLETIVAIVTDQPHDLRPLEGAGARGHGGQRSSLQALFDRVERGASDYEASREIRYDVAKLSFLLDPRSPRPLAEPRPA